jgi:hypothetical protein
MNQTGGARPRFSGPNQATLPAEGSSQNTLLGGHVSRTEETATGSPAVQCGGLYRYGIGTAEFGWVRFSLVTLHRHPPFGVSSRNPGILESWSLVALPSAPGKIFALHFRT